MTDNNKDWFLRAPKDGMTKADYWEAQAVMWNQNYKDAVDEIEWLRNVFLEIVYQIRQGNNVEAMDIAAIIAEAAVQQKESE